MRAYHIVLKDGQTFNINADDVDVDCCNEDHVSPHHYNFLQHRVGEDDITVASVPFDNVLYISDSH